MIKKEYILLAVLSAGFSFSVQGQTTWTKQDSIKLKEILDGTTDISINPTVKQEIDLLFSTPAQIHSIPILPVEELLPKPENLRQIYAIPGFRLDNTRIYYNTQRRNKYILNTQRFSISATTEYGKRARVLLQQKTDFKFDVTQKLGYHVYAGYSRSSGKSAILPGTVSPLYLGSGFSYDINRQVQVKTGVRRQFNIIHRRWEWVWETSVGISF